MAQGNKMHSLTNLIFRTEKDVKDIDTGRRVINSIMLSILWVAQNFLLTIYFSLGMDRFWANLCIGITSQPSLFVLELFSETINKNISIFMNVLLYSLIFYFLTRIIRGKAIVVLMLFFALSFALLDIWF
jgi:hypothetical protein